MITTRGIRCPGCWLVVTAVSAGCLRTAFTENAFGLTLTLPRPEHSLATRATVLLQRDLEISSTALAVEIPGPLMNGVSVRGEDGGLRARAENSSAGSWLAPLFSRSWIETSCGSSIRI